MAIDDMKKKDPKMIYISGPYSKGLWENNLRKVIEVAELVYRNGNVPVIPHTMTTLWALVHQKPKGEWLWMDKEMVKNCDEVIRIKGESEGAEEEVELAKDLGIPVTEVEVNYDSMFNEYTVYTVDDEN